jgi:hypothetical protein
MSDKYEGITEALEYALFTCQPVNVSLNRGEVVKREGIINKVDDDYFHILLDETGEKESVDISEVEYVEYS